MANFRCASISWFQVVSQSVSHWCFSASASTGLSELFFLASGQHRQLGRFFVVVIIVADINRSGDFLFFLLFFLLYYFFWASGRGQQVQSYVSWQNGPNLMRMVMTLMVMMMVTVTMMELKITVMMMILCKGCALVTLTQLCCVVNYPWQCLLCDSITFCLGHQQLKAHSPTPWCIRSTLQTWWWWWWWWWWCWWWWWSNNRRHIPFMPWPPTKTRPPAH